MQARRRTFLFLLSATVAAAGAGPAYAGRAAYPEYRVTVVGPANSRANDINNAGVVVGYYSTGSNSTRAFLNRGRGVVSLGTLGGTASSAAAINDKGQVLGNWTTSAGQQRGFIYYHGRQRDIGTANGNGTGYTDINNAGYATAIAYVAADDGQHSFLRAPNGSFRDIGSLLPYERPVTSARALNNRNQVTGESAPLTFPDQSLRAILWSRGTMRDLGDLGWTPNGGSAINDRGQVAGYATLPVGLHQQVAVLYSNGRVINLDGRPDTEYRFSGATGINNLGHVVGYSDHLSGFIHRGRRMESLNALIDPGLGWDIQRPAAINDAGQIAATGYRNGIEYAVRLDLIRPCLESAPALELDAEDAALLRQGAPEAAAAEARAQAEAQAREVAVPVKQ